eukprot:6491348-Amphidinium_carterae.2
MFTGCYLHIFAFVSALVVVGGIAATISGRVCMGAKAQLRSVLVLNRGEFFRLGHVGKTSCA